MKVAKLAASVGIGAAKLEIKLPTNKCVRGSSVNGIVALKGGRVPQFVNVVTVDLIEHWGDGESHYTKKRDGRVLASDIEVGPYVEFTYPFKFAIVDWAMLPGSNSTGGWRISAMADISQAVNPRAAIELAVLLQPQIVAVQLALERLDFIDSKVYPTIEEDAERRYRASPRLKDQLVGASLTLHADTDYVRGELVLTRETDERYPICIPSECLITAEGNPDSSGAVPYLKAILAEAFVFPPDQGKDLLRASSRPKGEGLLLKPVSGLANPNEVPRLVRPVEESDRGQ